VKSDDGSICADVFASSWAPTLNIRFVVDTILSMMSNPMPEHAVEPEIATQMQQNEEAYNATARQWTQQYAQ
jgi:ubiquitin-protein ligase